MTACAGDDGGTGAPGGTEAHGFCVDETNRYRAMNGKAAVVHSAALEAYANCGIFQSGTSVTLVQDFGR